MKLILLLISTVISFYTLSFQPLSGPAISCDTFQGKRVLLVNVATGSIHKNQLAELETLQQLYGDSLVVIAFPTNSFGHEHRSNAALQQYFTDSIHATYHVAALSDVTGTNANPVYNWLQQESSNGSADLFVSSDFQKILIDKTGNVKGIFSGRLSPLDSTLQQAIQH